MAFFDDEDDPFGDECGDFNPPYDPFGDDTIVPVQLPAHKTQTVPPLFPSCTTANDRLEQHALHAIFLAGSASEVICAGWVE